MNTDRATSGELLNRPTELHATALANLGSVNDYSAHGLPLLLRVEQAAQLLGIGRTRMFAMVRDGAIDSVQIGASRRISTTALVRYVDSLPVSHPPMP